MLFSYFALLDSKVATEINRTWLIVSADFPLSTLKHAHRIIFLYECADSLYFFKYFGILEKRTLVCNLKFYFSLIFCELVSAVKFQIAVYKDKLKTPVILKVGSFKPKRYILRSFSVSLTSKILTLFLFSI